MAIQLLGEDKKTLTEILSVVSDYIWAKETQRNETPNIHDIKLSLRYEIDFCFSSTAEKEKYQEYLDYLSLFSDNITVSSFAKLKDGEIPENTRIDAISDEGFPLKYKNGVYENIELYIQGKREAPVVKEEVEYIAFPDMETMQSPEQNHLNYSCS